VKTWHKLLRSLKVNAKTPEQMDFARRFSDVMLCREMGWTERQLKEENSDEFYEDCMRVFSMEASYLDGERKLAAKRNKRGR